MHLPTGASAVYNHSGKSAIPAVAATTPITSASTTTTAATVCGTADWNLIDCKGGILEPPSSCSSSSPPGSQDLWWTERLVVEAQQEFPGELGKKNVVLAQVYALRVC